MYADVNNIQNTYSSNRILAYIQSYDYQLTYICMYRIICYHCVCHTVNTITIIQPARYANLGTYHPHTTMTKKREKKIELTHNIFFKVHITIKFI